MGVRVGLGATVAPEVDDEDSGVAVAGFARSSGVMGSGSADAMVFANSNAAPHLGLTLSLRAGKKVSPVQMPNRSSVACIITCNARGKLPPSLGPSSELRYTTNEKRRCTPNADTGFVSG